MKPNKPGEFMPHGPRENKPHIIMENGKWRECTYSKLRREAPMAIRRRWPQAQDWCQMMNDPQGFAEMKMVADNIKWLNRQWQKR